MRWRQFLTPVESIDADEAARMLDQNTDLTILDVRQPGEYEQGHIPGARLLPVDQLLDKIDELDRHEPLLVYCASGGRSRMAAQLLAGKGFDNILNLSGGFKAWEGGMALGEFDRGLEYFSDLDSVDEILKVAYGLEEAMEEFYKYTARDLRAKDGSSQELVDLFETLGRFETGHKKALMNVHVLTPDVTTMPLPLEGGLSSEEYMNRLGLDPEKTTDILEFAMAVEIQAMDMYMRASQKAHADGKELLLRLASEEKKHLKQLGRLMDRYVKETV
ncbi:MAG: rhodanese-like domain-containing protein [Desulfovibrionales bacterium]